MSKLLNVKLLQRKLEEVANPKSRVRMDASAKWQNRPAEIREALFLHEVSRPIKDALAASAAFQGGVGYMVQMDCGSIGFHAEQAGLVLTRQVIQGSTPSQAIAWLVRVLATTSAKGIRVLAVRGVELDGSVALGHGVTLCRFSDVPKSKIKDWVTAPESVSSDSLDTFYHPPTAALITSLHIEPFLHGVEDGGTPAQLDPHRASSLLYDALLSLTIVGPVMPIAAGSWFQFDDNELEEAASFSGVSYAHSDIRPPFFTADQRVNPDEVARIVPRFLGLGDLKLKLAIRLSLRRFHQAMMRPPHGDRALDLAIALESLLVDGAGEINYRIGLRAALLLGGPIGKRLETRAYVEALYDLRSKLVHNGVLETKIKVKGVGKVDSVAVVEKATGIVAEVLREVLMSGEIPDWYKFELKAVD